VKADVTQWDREAEENFKRLNGPVEIHVKDGVLIVPYSSIWACYFITDEEKSIVSGVRLDLLHCRPGGCPGLDSSLHPNGRTDG
jgi:hypothetical protein